MSSTSTLTAPLSTLSQDHPFPGLRAYEEYESAWFYGRGREINELLKRLRRARFLAVIGPSGCGKSSLIKAGVLPNIRDGYLDAHWRIAPFRPGEQPIRNLAGSIASVDGVPPDQVLHTLRTGPLGLVEALASPTPEQSHTLILVDQFEELFQFVQRNGEAARDEAKAFLKLLLTAAAAEEGSAYVIVTMRIEWLNECATYTGLAEAINEGLYLVPQMSRRQFQQAILGPIEGAGGSVTSALLDRMLNDLDGRSDQLPVLQHALMRMWDQCQEGGALDVPLYMSVGTLSDCLKNHAEEVYRELTPADQRLAELLFKSITQVTKNRRVRRPRTLKEIGENKATPWEQFVGVISAFAKEGRSFLVTSPGALSDASVVDISHEALIRQWTQLREWVDEEARLDAQASRLEGTAAQWIERDRDKDLLYRGEPLAEAEKLKDRINPNGPAPGFLAASRAADRFLRIQRILFWILVPSLLAAVLVSVLAIRAQQAKAEAEKNILLAQRAQVQAARSEKQVADGIARLSQQLSALPKTGEDRAINEVKASLNELKASVGSTQVARVYIQYSGPAQLALAKSVQSELLSKGCAVPDPENVGSKAPSQTELRYFNDQDVTVASVLARALASSDIGAVIPKRINNPSNVVPAGQLELWLGLGAKTANTPPKQNQLLTPPQLPSEPVAIPDPGPGR